MGRCLSKHFKGLELPKVSRGEFLRILSSTAKTWALIGDYPTQFVLDLKWQKEMNNSIGPSGNLQCISITCMETFQICLTIGPIQLFISFQVLMSSMTMPMFLLYQYDRSLLHCNWNIAFTQINKELIALVSSKVNLISDKAKFLLVNQIIPIQNMIFATFYHLYLNRKSP